MNELITLEGFSLKKGLKKIGKGVKKVSKGIAKVTTSAVKFVAPLAVTVLSTAVGVPIPASAAKSVINKAARKIKSSTGKRAISALAKKQIGLNSTQKVTPDKMLAFQKIAKNLENKAISKLSVDIAKKEIAPTVKRQQVEKAVEKKSEKWTPAQVDKFNELMAKGSISDLPEITKAVDNMKESPGDQYYKKGLLEGYPDDLKLLATKIFSQNPYAAVSLVSYKHVENIIEAYVYSCLKLSEKSNQSKYYTGTTEAERQQFFGNLYVKIAYLYFKGYITEEDAKKAGFDYVTRDQVWIVISLIKKFAEESKAEAFLKFWKPYEYKKEIPKEGLKLSVLPIVAGGVAALLILPKLFTGDRGKR